MPITDRIFRVSADIHITLMLWRGECMRGSVILHITSQRVNKGVVSGEIIITAYIYGFLWTFQFSLFINRGHLLHKFINNETKTFHFRPCGDVVEFLCYDFSPRTAGQL